MDNEYDRLINDENPFIEEDESLSTNQKVCYGLGHVFNDITATIWFSYTLVFFQKVVGMSSTMAGFFLFFGQIIDAISTPVIGLFVDKYKNKKKLIILGCMMEMISFPILYYNWNLSLLWKALIYICIIFFFQISWALIQISHLSLIPEITRLSQERGKLTSIRYLCTVSTNILMFLTAWVIFKGVKSTSNNWGSLIEPKDSFRFQILALIATVTGVITSLFFYVLLKIPTTYHLDKTILYRDKSKLNYSKIIKFCKSPQLYQVAIVFTSCKLLINMALVYLPLFINESAINESGSIASIPLVSYISSMVATISIDHIKAFTKNDKIVFTMGCLLSVCGSFLVFFNPNNEFTFYYLCLASVCFGSGNAITSVLSLCVTANLVGKDTDCGAFIYSSVTFSDKFINGIAIVGIEFLKCSDFTQCTHYYRDVLAFSSGSLAIIGLLVFWTLPKILIKCSK
ncbi:major facilitator superfamily domain-containing protein 12-like isoform X1 [Daktulosphaira vitifoliae]|uniref:major facilitator superfamily domain-containing protein 12-like isoform X1 n=1 Tax=Daktulosphaira vitifoliae TaxID=58002 RepID=UPI0021A97AD9|nr:major facilitator superfamily domain-containing protein 12-like isoform X1 [Daktulosphaira vitifoliae]XP_050539813.1 major facilitator superfamily domain-containing protein 12-like isoform X1 [Daktulosphaira vitifoliae]XP_050539814.1 major facilitator superfamily domain-containing protein 12-like isoform X1 [Daktulosphaira vitifoliae]